MSDAELTELCALAMGWKHLGAVGMVLPAEVKYPSEADERFKGKLWCLGGGNDWWLDPEGHNVCGLCSQIPDPLNDDAQAMALIKKLGLQVINYHDICEPETEPQGMWCVIPAREAFDRWPKSGNLNRAVVACVAKMQQSAVNV